MQVRYRTSVTAELSQESKPEFIIANNSATPVPLEDIELDYWFKDDLGQTHMFNCDWAQIGCKNVMGEFHTLSDGVFSLTIHFQPGLDPLLPGQDTGEIKVRFNRSDWSEFSQSDDYSFTLANDYVAWEKVALYLGGKLVWGSQPDFYPANSPTVTFIASLATPVPDLPTLSAMPEETRTPKKPSPGLSPTAIVSPRGNSSNPGWILWGATILFAFAAGCLIAAIRFLRKNR
jgi:hypothetical protein